VYVCSLSLAVVECYSEQEVVGIVRQIVEALQVGVRMAWVPGSLPLRRGPGTKEAGTRKPWEVVLPLIRDGFPASFCSTYMGMTLFTKTLRYI